MNKTLQLLLALVWISTGITTNKAYSDETTLGQVPETGVMSGSVSGPNKFTAAKVYAKNLDKNMLYMVYTNKGQYRMPNLMVGAYEIWSEHEKLRSEHRWVRIEKSKKIIFDFTLKTGPADPLTFNPKNTKADTAVSYD